MEKKHTYGSLDQEFYLPIIYIVIINSYIITVAIFLKVRERIDKLSPKFHENRSPVVKNLSSLLKPSTTHWIFFFVREEYVCVVYKYWTLDLAL